MPNLLVSLGASWMIVPEAFHRLPPGKDGFRAVHLLTSDSTAVEPAIKATQRYFTAYPDVALTITRVDGFTDLRTEADHFAFEEVLYRWYLAESRLDPPYVCLAGGFKTMSAAVQIAASILGAREVFHVLADPQKVTDPARLREALERNEVAFVKLGPEPGWPQFRGATPEAFPLSLIKTEGCVRWVTAPDDAFRQRVREVAERSHRIAECWEQLPGLPFAALATWSAAGLGWLQEPLEPETDHAWVAALPKIELHCHLGGFATRGELLREVRAEAEDPQSLPSAPEPAPPGGWPIPEAPIPLPDYMKLGDATGSALLKDPGCLRRQCELLYRHLQEQNVLYAEIRCSPANYADPGRRRSPWDVLCDIKQTFDRCMAVGASVPLDTTRTASVPLATTRTASVPLAATRTASVPLAATPPSPLPPAATPTPHLPPPATTPPPNDPAAFPAARQFTPFDEDTGYRQTRRHLPHRHQEGATAFVTFRLADSLPKPRLQQWIAERDGFLRDHPKPWSDATWAEFRRRFPDRLELWLDEAHGECLLGKPGVADSVADALRHFDGTRYILDAFAVMPNHVHALVKPLPGFPLDSIMRTWKSFTAKTINRMLDRSGQVWEHESFDHLVRSGSQLERFRRYILADPEKAGLKGGTVVGSGVGLVIGGGCDLWEAGGEASRRLASTDQPSQRLPATRINLILIATRKEKGDYRAAISRHLALAVTASEHWTDPTQCRVVGVDLAGYENPGTRAHYYREDFAAIHRCGLALTVHAGENDDAEGIWSAVFDLNARRIGHGLRLLDSPELLRSVADRGIGIEMCPFANYQIVGASHWLAQQSRQASSLPTSSSPPPHTDPPIPPGPSQRFATTDQPRQRLAVTYPLKAYLDAGIRVSVNTDNIGISNASLTDNLIFAARLCPNLTRLDLLRLLRHALDTAFLSPEERAQLLRKIEPLLPLPNHP